MALYTDSFPPEGHRALEVRDIPKQRVEYIEPPSLLVDNEPRFRDCWTKLRVFELVQYERVVLMDADMLVVRNMDEVMEMGLEGRVLGACRMYLGIPLNVVL